MRQKILVLRKNDLVKVIVSIRDAETRRMCHFESSSKVSRVGGCLRGSVFGRQRQPEAIPGLILGHRVSFARGQERTHYLPPGSHARRAVGEYIRRRLGVFFMRCIEAMNAEDRQAQEQAQTLAAPFIPTPPTPPDHPA